METVYLAGGCLYGVEAFIRTPQGLSIRQVVAQMALQNL